MNNDQRKSWNEMSYEEQLEARRRKRSAFMRGRYNHPTTPLGYIDGSHPHPNNYGRYLHKNPDLQEAFESLFKQLLQGELHSFKESAKWLNDAQTHRHFFPSKVRTILENTMMCGWMRVPESYGAATSFVKCNNVDAYLTKEEFIKIHKRIKKEGWK